MSGPARGGRILRSSPWARLVTALVLSTIAMIAMVVTMLDLAGGRAARGVASRLTGDDTVVVWAHGLESADAAAARAREILIKVPGVRGAQWLDPRSDDRLVAAALGAPDGPGADFRLISVTAPRTGKSMAVQLVQALAEQDLPAKATGRALRGAAVSADAALSIGLLLPLLAILGYGGVCWIEARLEMRRGRATIELMRLFGADEGYIVGEVRRRVSGLAFVAAVWGAAAALIAAAVVSRQGLAGAIGGISRGDLLTPWPALILELWLAGLAGAHLAARGRLRRPA